MTPAKKIKILIAKIGLDGHDVGAKIVVRALIDAGFEVIYTGLKKSPEEIAFIASDEDVDVIGLSILSGSHFPLCQQFQIFRSQHNLEDKLWVIGGTIPTKDHSSLYELGVDQIFPVGTSLQSIVDFIRGYFHESRKPTKKTIHL